MLIYIFNSHFPVNSGFGKRCKKEIELLSKDNEIIVICRGNNNFEEFESMHTKFNEIKIIHFNAKQLTERINKKTYKSFFYEFSRNIDLLLNLSKAILKVFWENKKSKDTKIYTIVSPITVPLAALIFAKIFRFKPEVIEFHDLEPELAIHIKGLNKNNIVVKIEYLLEKLMCHSYNKIIVTNNTQANKIIKRTSIQHNKICIIPNSIQIDQSKNKVRNLRQKYGFSNSDYIIGYIGNFSYDYTITGIISIFNLLSKYKVKLHNVKFVLVGDGEGLQLMKEVVCELKLENIVTFTRRINNTMEIIKMLDLGIIPWLKDSLSESILPTKLFEFMANKIAILVPDFGEFRKLIKNGKNGMLYRNETDLLYKLDLLMKNKKISTNLGKMAFNTYLRNFNEELLIRKYYDFINK